MLSPTQGHTPKSSTPLSGQQDSVPAPLPNSTNPPTKQASNLPPPRHLLPIIGCSSTVMSFLKLRVAGCLLDFLPVHLLSLANGNPGHSGKGGVHSSRKQGLGEGCEFMLHILWIGAHGGEGETVQAHPLQLVSTPLLSPVFSRCRASHTLTHCLIYLMRYIQGLCIKRVSSILAFLQPLPPPEGQKPPCHLFLKRQTGRSLHATNIGI